MTHSQWHLPPKVWVDGELMSKKSLSPKICEQRTAFLLTAYCFALPRAQSSHGLKVLVTWIPRDLAIDLVMGSNGWPSLTWRLLMSCLIRVIAVTAFLSIVFLQKPSSGTQPSPVLIQQSSTILPIGVITMIFLVLSLEILFPCKSLHTSKKRFAPADGQNFTGHSVWTCSCSFTWHTITRSSLLWSYLESILQCWWHHTYHCHHW